jgi:acetoacetyl-CoA synthetase
MRRTPGLSTRREDHHSAAFSTYPGVWRHGDWITITSHDGVQVHGRSDATMNKSGARMGSAEIYEAIDTFPQVHDSLIVGVEQPDGYYWRVCCTNG